VFGFEPADEVEPLEIQFLADSRSAPEPAGAGLPDSASEEAEPGPRYG
jgi:hypothetical protein